MKLLLIIKNYIIIEENFYKILVYIFNLNSQVKNFHKKMENLNRVVYQKQKFHG